MKELSRKDYFLNLLDNMIESGMSYDKAFRLAGEQTDKYPEEKMSKYHVNPRIREKNNISDEKYEFCRELFNKLRREYDDDPNSSDEIEDFIATLTRRAEDFLSSGEISYEEFGIIVYDIRCW